MGVTLDRALRGFDRADAVAFVADLWAAGGWETTVDGGTVTVSRGGTTRRLVVVHEDTAAVDADSADAVVVTGGVDPKDAIGDAVPENAAGNDTDAEFIGAGDLHRRLTYGVSVDERERLLDRHFDDTTVGPPEDADEDPGDDTAGDVAAASGPAAVGWGRTDVAETNSIQEADSIAETEGVAEASDESDTTVDGAEETSRSGDIPATRLAVVGVVLLALLAAVGAAGFVLGSNGQTAAEAPTVAAAQNMTTQGAAMAGAANVPEPAMQRRYVDLRPTCERPPELVVQTQVGALRNNDPEINDGIVAAWRFVSPDRRQTPESYLQFGRTMLSDRYEPLRASAEAEYGPLERDDDAARQQVTVTTTDGTTATYEWRLTRQTSEGYDGCWMVDDITRED